MSTEAVLASEMGSPVRGRSGHEGWLRWLMPLLVLGTTLAVFWPVIHGEFLRHEDHRHVRPSELIGFETEHLINMLTRTPRGYCEPLTWLSYTFDLRVSGLSSRGVHTTNLALHTIAALLVYALAIQLFAAASPGKPRSAAIYLGAGAAGLLFAVHPLRVEAVAWASARAYPLAAIFALLAIMCHLQSAAPRYTASARRGWLGATVLCYGASLLSAPLAIALPFVLLALDYWPLRRIGALRSPNGSGTWVLLEKSPMLLIAGLVTGLMPIVSAQLNEYHGQFSIHVRLVRGAFSTAWGLLKTFWPSNLSPLYELPPGQEPSASVWIAAAVAVVGVSVAALAIRRRFPAVTVAWFTWLLLFLPLSGIVHYGTQLAADRYTYLPGIVAAVFAGGLVRWLMARPGLPAVAASGAVVAVLALAFIARANVAYWGNTVVLFRHALEVNPRSHTALRSLGHDFRLQSRYAEAENLYRRTLAVAPQDYSALRHLASLRARAGDLADASALYQRALPLYDGPLYDGKDSADIRVEYALVLARRGLIDDAADALLPLMGPESERGDALRHLAAVAWTDHKLAEKLLARAYELIPDHPEIMNDLAWLRATSPVAEVRDARQAVELATKACGDSPHPEFLDTLAAAHAEAGDYDKAVQLQKDVIRAGERMGRDTTTYRKHLSNFEQRCPVREPETIPADELLPTTAAAK